MADTNKPKLSELISDAVSHIPAEKMAAVLTHEDAPKAMNAIHQLMGITVPDVIDTAGQVQAKELGIDTIAHPENSGTTSGTGTELPSPSQEMIDISNKAQAVKDSQQPKQVTPTHVPFDDMLRGVGEMLVDGVLKAYRSAKETATKGH